MTNTLKSNFDGTTVDRNNESICTTNTKSRIAPITIANEHLKNRGVTTVLELCQPTSNCRNESLINSKTQSHESSDIASPTSQSNQEEHIQIMCFQKSCHMCAFKDSFFHSDNIEMKTKKKTMSKTDKIINHYFDFDSFFRKDPNATNIDKPNFDYTKYVDYVWTYIIQRLVVVSGYFFIQVVHIFQYSSRKLLVLLPTHLVYILLVVSTGTALPLSAFISHSHRNKNINKHNHDDQTHSYYTLLFSSIACFCIALLVITPNRISKMSKKIVSSSNNNNISLTTSQVSYTERDMRYARILSKAIQCKTVSMDPIIDHNRPKERGDDDSFKDNHESIKSSQEKNDASQLDEEFKKLHDLLRNEFPILHKKYPPLTISKHSLLYRIEGDRSIDESSTITKKGNVDESQHLKPILLCSHLDVVPTPSPEMWDYSPFAGDIVNGFIWGRGAIDNKHNVIGQLAAVESILAKNIRLRRTIYIAMGHDEEIGGLNGARNISNHLMKNLCSNSSNSESNNYSKDKIDSNYPFEFILDEGTMMVSNAIPGQRGHLAMIGTHEKGWMTVELTVKGNGGHSSIPSIDKPSSNPIAIMSRAIHNLEEQQMSPHFEKGSSFRNTLEFIADELSPIMKFLCKNLYIFQYFLKNILVRASNGAAASIRTTTAVTKIYGGEKINALPNEVKAYVNHRIHPLDTIESVLEHDRCVINDPRVSLRLTNGSTPPSPISDYKSYGFSKIQKCVKSIFGHSSTPMLVMGNTDTRWYWKLSKNIFRFSPLALSMKETAMFHGLNERIGISALGQICDFYERLIIECDKDEPTIKLCG